MEENILISMLRDAHTCNGGKLSKTEQGIHRTFDHSKVFAAIDKASRKF